MIMFWIVQVDKPNHWGPFVTEAAAKEKIEDLVQSWPDGTFVLTKQMAKIQAKVVANYE